MFQRTVDDALIEEQIMPVFHIESSFDPYSFITESYTFQTDYEDDKLYDIEKSELILAQTDTQQLTDSNEVLLMNAVNEFIASTVKMQELQTTDEISNQMANFFPP